MKKRVLATCLCLSMVFMSFMPSTVFADEVGESTTPSESIPVSITPTESHSAPATEDTTDLALESVSLPQGDAIDGNVFSAADLTLPDADGSYPPIDASSTSDIAALHQGTIIVDFTYSGSTNSSFIGISDGNVGSPNTYFHFYVSSQRIGYEIRDSVNGDFDKSFANVTITPGARNRAAFVADPLNGYRIFLNGAEVLNRSISQLPARGYGFLDDITALNTGYLGKTHRVDAAGRPAANEYLYNGFLKNIEVKNHVLTTDELIAATTLPEDTLVYTSGPHTIPDTSSAVAISPEDLSDIKSLDKGTVVIKFTPDSQSTVQSLIGINNSTAGNANSYFSIYISNGLLGFELRRQAGGDFHTAKIPVEMTPGVQHTVAMTADPSEGYRIYFDGFLEYTLPPSWFSAAGYGFISAIPGVNTGYIGKTARAGSANKYPYVGVVDKVDIYSSVMTEDELIAETSSTAVVGIEKKVRLFDFGDYNAPGIRIPSILRTKNDVIVTTCDIRFGNSNDPPNNCDIGIRRSFDSGATWSEPEMLLNFLDFPNEPQPQNMRSAAFVDSVLMEDRINSRLFLFVDVMSGGFSAPNSVPTSGFTTVAGENRLILKDAAGNSYTVGADNKVYDSSNVVTSYSIGHHFALLENDVEISNIFYLVSPLQVLKTIFTAVMHSDDDGANWSEPVLLNDRLKAEGMKHCGTAPGIGIQLENGPYAGRLVVPYYYNTTQTSSIFDPCVVYSDDYGVSWQMGASANANRAGGRQQMSESQIVEMPDGQLKMFARHPGAVSIATSFDGGATWYSIVENTNLPLSSTSGCQISVINYSREINEKPAVILSSASAKNRSNGTIRVGLVEENGTYPVDPSAAGYDPKAAGKPKYTFNWVSQKVIRDGEYGYSCLMELPNGNIACLYEEQSAVNSVDHVKYSEFTLEYLMG